MLLFLYNKLCIPKQGVHKYRICGLSIIDLIFCFCFCYFTYIYTSINCLITFTFYVIGGEFIHHILGVKTYLYNRIIKSFIN